MQRTKIDKRAKRRLDRDFRDFGAIVESDKTLSAEQKAAIKKIHDDHVAEHARHTAAGHRFVLRDRHYDNGMIALCGVWIDEHGNEVPK